MISNISQSLAENLDFLAFAVGLLAVLLIAHWFAFRRIQDSKIIWCERLGYVLFISLSWVLTQHAEKTESNQMRGMIEGVLPTYASELQRMGHAQIDAQARPDDERYARIIEAEKRWLRVNRSIVDVYTFRRAGKGQGTMIVDSETDYDRNGVIQGDREQRTAIGEEFSVKPEALDLVFQGQRVFDLSPVPDRWGTWITAYAPVMDDNGRVEAAVGADMDATTWMQAVMYARLGMLGYLAGCFVLGIGALMMISFRTLAKDHAKQRETTAQIAESRSRLESIINSIDGVVWEWDPANHAFIFVSQQAKEVLGFDADQVKANPYHWCQNIHPDDSKAATDQRDLEIERVRNYSMDYRFQRPDGRVVWLRERGVCVPDKNGRTACVRGILLDITDSKEAADKLEELNKRMVETSRLAGMAEVASGVLHNVGNVLNSVNVSAAVICDAVQESKAPALERLGQLLESQNGHLADFITADPRGKAVPQFISQLARTLGKEREFILGEMAGLAKNITHIKQVVMMQQSFARTGGGTEPLDAVEMIEDALHVNEASLTRHGVQITRNFESVPMVMADRNKVLQILINLIRNAKHAMTMTDETEPHLRIGVRKIDDTRLSITFSDNGVGMSAETLKQLFSYGFTTRRDGHGFGLHSGANAAREMGGRLTASSDGLGQGSTFNLELPLIGTCPVELTPQSAARGSTRPETPLPPLPALKETTPIILGTTTTIPASSTPVPTPTPEPALTV